MSYGEGDALRSLLQQERFLRARGGGFMPTDRRWRTIAAIPAFVALLPAALILSEWVNVQIILQPEAVEETYHFGSDQMVVYGGWRYRSAALYVWSAFVEGTLLLSGAGLILYGSWRARSRPMIVGYVLLALYLGSDLERRAELAVIQAFIG